MMAQCRMWLQPKFLVCLSVHCFSDVAVGFCLPCCLHILLLFL